jgi:Ulp1 family protease
MAPWMIEMKRRLSFLFGSCINQGYSAHIFTLDSMGSNHPQAQKILQQYLIDEAKDKKNLTEVRLATKRKVAVRKRCLFAQYV